MNWVTAEILTVGAILTGPIILLAIVLLRLLPDRGDGKLAFQEFSIARYPVDDASDRGRGLRVSFHAQPGYRPETGARLRRERRRIFRLYLRALAVDFRSLHAAARKLVADAPERHADLGRRSDSLPRFVFWWRMTLSRVSAASFRHSTSQTGYCATVPANGIDPSSHGGRLAAFTPLSILFAAFHRFHQSELQFFLHRIDAIQLHPHLVSRSNTCDGSVRR